MDDLAGVGSPRSYYVLRNTGDHRKMAQNRNNKTMPKQPGPGIFTSKDGHFELQGPCLIRGRYNVIKILDSSGQSAVLVLAEDLFEQKKLVVIKILHAHLYQIGVQESHVLMELAALDPMNISHTLRLLTTVVYGSHYCLVLEPLLPDPLTTVFAELPQHKLLGSIRKIGLRLLACVGFLHHHNMIHTDLKPENLLLKDENDLDSVHIVDFGSTVHYVNSEVSLYYKDFQLQTPLYRAPEVLFGVPFGKEIDMWSFGCVLAELYLGQPLFLGNSVEEITGKIKDIFGPFPSRLFRKGKYYKKYEKLIQDDDPSNGTLKLMECLQCEDILFADLLTGLLKYDPEERFTASEAACHPFFASYFPVAYLMPDYKGKMNVSTGGLCPESPSSSTATAVDVKRMRPKFAEPPKIRAPGLLDMNETYLVKPFKKSGALKQSKLTEETVSSAEHSAMPDETKDILEETVESVAGLDEFRERSFSGSVKEEISETDQAMKHGLMEPENDTLMESEWQSQHFVSREHGSQGKRKTAIQHSGYVARPREQTEKLNRSFGLLSPAKRIHGDASDSSHLRYKRKLSEVNYKDEMDPTFVVSYACEKDCGRAFSRDSNGFSRKCEKIQHKSDSESEHIYTINVPGSCSQCGHSRERQSSSQPQKRRSVALEESENYKQDRCHETQSDEFCNGEIHRHLLKGENSERKCKHHLEYRASQNPHSRARVTRKNQSGNSGTESHNKLRQVIHDHGGEATKIGKAVRNINTCDRIDQQSPHLLQATNRGSACYSKAEKHAERNNRTVQSGWQRNEFHEVSGTDSEDEDVCNKNSEEGATHTMPKQWRTKQQQDMGSDIPRANTAKPSELGKPTLRFAQRKSLNRKNVKSSDMSSESCNDRHQSMESLRCMRDRGDDMSRSDLGSSDRRIKRSRESYPLIIDINRLSTEGKDSNNDGISGDEEYVELMSPASQTRLYETSQHVKKPSNLHPLKRNWEEPSANLPKSKITSPGYRLRERDHKKCLPSEPYDFPSGSDLSENGSPQQGKPCRQLLGVTQLKFGILLQQDSRQQRNTDSNRNRKSGGTTSEMVNCADVERRARRPRSNKNLKYYTKRELFKLQDDVLGK